MEWCWCQTRGRLTGKLLGRGPVIKVDACMPRARLAQGRHAQALMCRPRVYVNAILKSAPSTLPGRRAQPAALRELSHRPLPQVGSWGGSGQRRQRARHIARCRPDRVPQGSTAGPIVHNFPYRRQSGQREANAPPLPKGLARLAGRYARNEGAVGFNVYMHPMNVIATFQPARGGRRSMLYGRIGFS